MLGPFVRASYTVDDVATGGRRPQWAATTYVDAGSKKTYIYACNWIQECDAAALNWIGERTAVARMGHVGVGLMENPSLMKRGEYYYWYAIMPLWLYRYKRWCGVCACVWNALPRNRFQSLAVRNVHLANS